MQDTSLYTIFITGLLTGGLTCLAVQGGLLASIIAQREEEKERESYFAKASKDKGDKSTKGAAMPILAFLIAKLVAYTILGFLLGWFGSLFQLSFTVQVILQFFVAIFMVGTALAILNVHPIFRYFIIQPPKFITRRVKGITKSRDIFAPGLLGAFTVFLPCGTTQAMMLLAVASGQPLLGALILFIFVLGTSPLFFTLGYLATRLGDTLHKKFLRLAALAIIVLALFNLNNAIALTGKTSWTFGGVAKGAFCTIAYCANDNFNDSEVKAAVSEQTIVIENSGYSPREFTVKAGSEVKINLVNNDGYTCAQAFTIPSLKLQKIVAPNTMETITFTAPKQKGQLAFMCSMGMYRGIINVN
jgi:sulfite exporter TauE/SafE